MRKKYILLKDTPELKKGAILQEMCENGDQDFECINLKDFKVHKDEETAEFTRMTIMKSPDWFEEIGIVEVPIKKLTRVKKFLENLK